MEKTVEVEAGDTLWSIAEKHLGSPYEWEQLYRENFDVIFAAQKRRGFKTRQGPDLIYAGTVLALPPQSKAPRTEG